MSANTSTSILTELPTEEELMQQIMLTATVVWRNQLSQKKINAWLHNFTGALHSKAYERRLALWLLANFVYYNEDEIRNLCRVLYRELIRRNLLDEGTSAGQQIVINIQSLLDRSRFVPLGKPGESSSLILYFFRTENSLPRDSFSEATQTLPDEVQTIFFVDDVTLTGTQARRYIRSQMKAIGMGKTPVLLTLFSTNDAVMLLESDGIKVVSCVNVDDRSRCFSPNSSVFHHFPKHKEPCFHFSEHYGKTLWPDHPLGYMNGAYLFGFFYNTPDNTLPIFWSTGSSWQPVVTRYSKQYGAKIRDSLAYELGQFI